MTHIHRFRLLITDNVYTTTARSRGGAGNTQFVEVEMPLIRRQCDCGTVEELRDGNWRKNEND
jgi:hypothetical protein